MDLNTILELLKSIDPSPFFILSLIPYIFFLIYARKLDFLPRISYIGFSLTLLFVAMTIVFAVIAQIAFNDELTNIDPLHGSAEAFLTLSDALVVYGLLKFLQEKKEMKNS